MAAFLVEVDFRGHANALERGVHDLTVRGNDAFVVLGMGEKHGWRVSGDQFFGGDGIECRLRGICREEACNASVADVRGRADHGINQTDKVRAGGDLREVVAAELRASGIACARAGGEVTTCGEAQEPMRAGSTPKSPP
jgi:hypothetical protein